MSRQFVFVWLLCGSYPVFKGLNFLLSVRKEVAVLYHYDANIHYAYTIVCLVRK